MKTLLAQELAKPSDPLKARQLWQALSETRRTIEAEEEVRQAVSRKDNLDKVCITLIADKVSTEASAKVGAGIAQAEEARLAGVAAVTQAAQAAAAQSSVPSSAENRPVLFDGSENDSRLWVPDRMVNKNANNELLGRALERNLVQGTESMKSLV